MVKIFKKSLIIKGKEYAIVGFGEMTKKAVLVKKDSKGKYVIYNRRKVRL